jgi:predicted alpha-1,2-mannosidase
MTSHPQYPNEKTETNETGTYYYSGYDDRVHKGDVSYTGYSIWDIFRAEWAFQIMFAPERVPGMITSMLQTYEESGRLPMWENLVETNIMVCTWASSMIAEALRKGIDDFDVDTAWKAVWKDAMVPPKDDLTLQYYDREEYTPLEVRAGLTLYKKNGWVPAIRTAEAGTRTLEYAWADFTVAVVANYTGHKNESAYFLERSENYRNVFNNDTTFMEARMEDGSWNDDPSTWTEGNKWIYTFNVPHNFSGLRALFNGTEQFENKLDVYFQGGHNDQSNEPSHATPFAYIYANQPHKAQAVIRDLLKTSYNVSVDGLSGNEGTTTLALSNLNID